MRLLLASARRGGTQGPTPESHLHGGWVPPWGLGTAGRGLPGPDGGEGVGILAWRTEAGAKEACAVCSGRGSRPGAGSEAGVLGVVG